MRGAGRSADLGMCLTSVESAGDQTADGGRLDWLAAAVLGFVSTEGNWAAEDCSGGLLDPGHGSWRGPCLWTVPSCRWSCRVARQKLQVPLDLLANCERCQTWDMTNAREKGCWRCSKRTCIAGLPDRHRATPTETNNKQGSNKLYKSLIDETNEPKLSSNVYDEVK